MRTSTERRVYKSSFVPVSKLFVLKGQGRSGSRGMPKRHEPISVDAYQLTNARLRVHTVHPRRKVRYVHISCFDLSVSILSATHSFQRPLLESVGVLTEKGFKSSIRYTGLPNSSPLKAKSLLHVVLLSSLGSHIQRLRS